MSAHRSTLVAICACTYKRPEGLRKLLAGLARQTFAGLEEADGRAPDMVIVIADNEGSEAARTVCAKFSLQHPDTPLTYVHEEKRGISHARNACLDHVPVDADFVAMLDDDEIPVPGWLDNLLLAQRATNADVILGRVLPFFAEGTPAWIAGGAFFGMPRRSYELDLREMDDLSRLTWAGTRNVLIRTAATRDPALRFDPSHALSGGEDTAFFAQMRNNGCQIVYSKHGAAYEYCPPERATFAYLAAERFRLGNVNTLLAVDAAGQAARSRSSAAADGLSHLGSGFRRLLTTLFAGRWSKDRFATGAFRIAYGLGMIAGAFGYRYQHYK